VRFLKDVVRVEADLTDSMSFEVSTQKRFVLNDDTDCRVDLVIASERLVCFIENKVNSGEGYRQLERYRDVLEEEKADQKFLCYCTKYWDQKDAGSDRFRQFRWADIHKLLTEYESDTLISHFSNFLRRSGMGTTKELSIEDLHVMESVVEVLGKLGDILEDVRHKYGLITGREAVWGDRYKQMAQFGRYVCYDKEVLESDTDEYSELGFGFNLKNTPSLYFWVWAKEESELWEKHKPSLFQKFEDGRREDRTYVAVMRPLTDLLSNPKMDEEIVGWFVEKFERIAQYEGFLKHQPAEKPMHTPDETT
jgi:hypothetical protein